MLAYDGSDGCARPFGCHQRIWRIGRGQQWQRQLLSLAWETDAEIKPRSCENERKKEEN